MKTISIYCAQYNEGDTMTLAQLAQEVEAQERESLKTGNFESFGDFLSYFDMHYRPMLERIENGEDISESDRHLLNFLAADLLDIFKEGSDKSEEDGDTVAVVVLNFGDMENFKRAQRFFDSDGPSQFCAGDWDENARTIEFVEGNDPERLAAALIEEMEREGITGYTWQAHRESLE